MNTTMTQEQTLAYMSASEHQTNHVLHLILSLTTLGLWFFVWLFVASSNMKKRNKIKSLAGMPTQFNFPRLLLWINFTGWAFLILLIVSAGDAKAEQSQKQTCLQFLEAGIYNSALEDSCGFNGGVKDKLKQIYTNGGCSSIVSPEEIDNAVKNVLDDTKARYQSLGGKAFCDGNKQSYDELAAQ